MATSRRPGAPRFRTSGTAASPVLLLRARPARPRAGGGSSHADAARAAARRGHAAPHPPPSHPVPTPQRRHKNREAARRVRERRQELVSQLQTEVCARLHAVGAGLPACPRRPGRSVGGAGGRSPLPARPAQGWVGRRQQAAVRGSQPRAAPRGAPPLAPTALPSRPRPRSPPSGAQPAHHAPRPLPAGRPRPPPSATSCGRRTSS